MARPMRSPLCAVRLGCPLALPAQAAKRKEKLYINSLRAVSSRRSSSLRYASPLYRPRRDKGWARRASHTNHFMAHSPASSPRNCMLKRRTLRAALRDGNIERKKLPTRRQRLRPSAARVVSTAPSTLRSPFLYGARDKHVGRPRLCVGFVRRPAAARVRNLAPRATFSTSASTGDAGVQDGMTPTLSDITACMVSTPRTVAAPGVSVTARRCASSAPFCPFSSPTGKGPLSARAAPRAARARRTE